MKSFIATKMAFLAAVVLVLMVGLSMIQGVVRDRQLHRSKAISSIGSNQVITGPVIHASCTETWRELVRDASGVSTIERRNDFGVTALPEILTVKSSADVQKRARSLHQVNVYNLRVQMTARWSSFEGLKARPHRENSRVSCATPVLMLSVTDPNGIRSASLKLDSQAGLLKAGTTHARYSRGVHAALPEGRLARSEPLTADFDLELFGTEELAIIPVAEMTQVQLHSNWQHPSFGGSFLPVERTIGAEGFDANWRVSSLASNVADGLRMGLSSCRTDSEEALEKSTNCLESIRVSFIDPVNPYTLSDRATKYGLLFVILTFAAVGLFEVMQRLRVHPVQYFFVGSAISIFFLLLVSLSEHMAFNMAYLVAAGACVLLLGYYGCHMLHGLWRGLPFGMGVSLLYGLLFLLLQLEQTALVVGAIALFSALAAVMFFTRKVDWYRMMSPAAAEAGQDA